MFLDVNFKGFVKCGNRYYLGTRRNGIIVYNENWNAGIKKK